MTKIRETKRKNKLKGKNESHLRCIDLACQLPIDFRKSYLVGTDQNITG